MVSRRDLLKLASLFTAAGSLPLLQACQQRQASQPNAPLRIGYLPITDATPLLVAHSQGLFQAEGLVGTGGDLRSNRVLGRETGTIRMRAQAARSG